MYACDLKFLMVMLFRWRPFGPIAPKLAWILGGMLLHASYSSSKVLHAESPVELATSNMYDTFFHIVGYYHLGSRESADATVYQIAVVTVRFLFL